MSSSQTVAAEIHSRTILSFWVYLMTDCILFASLFTTYVVLHRETFGGPTSAELFKLSTALIETLALLASSIACGLAMQKAVLLKRNATLWLFALSGLFGALFLVFEFQEFAELVNEGNSWQKSAFLSSYFTLVGTHGLHVTIGLFWMVVMMAQLLLQGLTAEVFRRLACLSLFWHFLDVVWIFIFTIVYLIGVL